MMRPALAHLVVTFGSPCPDDVQGWIRLPDLLDAAVRKKVQGKFQLFEADGRKGSGAATSGSQMRVHGKPGSSRFP